MKEQCAGIQLSGVVIATGMLKGPLPIVTAATLIVCGMEVRNGERDFSSVDGEGGECLLYKHCYSVILKNSILQTI